MTINSNNNLFSNYSFLKLNLHTHIHKWFFENVSSYTDDIHSKIHAFNMLLFGLPANSQMLSIVLLYEEIFIIGLVIVYIITEVLSSIIDEFKHTVNMYPFRFFPEIESFLDVFFLLLTSSIILYILIPTLGLLFNIEDNDPFEFSLFIIDGNGEQSKEIIYNSIINGNNEPNKEIFDYSTINGNDEQK